MLWWVKPGAGFSAEGRQQSGSITEGPIGARGQKGLKFSDFHSIAASYNASWNMLDLNYHMQQ